MTYAADLHKLADAIVAQLAAHPAFGNPSVQHAEVTSPAAIGLHGSTTIQAAIHVLADRWTQSLVRQQDGPFWFPATSAQVRDTDNHAAIAGEMTRALVELQVRRHRTASSLGTPAEPGAALDPPRS